MVILNHGGRQLDGAPATLDALSGCAAVGRARIRLAFDGGIRRGSDIFKAIALGAQHCFYRTGGDLGSCSEFLDLTAVQLHGSLTFQQYKGQEGVDALRVERDPPCLDSLIVPVKAFAWFPLSRAVFPAAVCARHPVFFALPSGVASRVLATPRGLLADVLRVSPLLAIKALFSEDSCLKLPDLEQMCVDHETSARPRRV